MATAERAASSRRVPPSCSTSSFFRSPDRRTWTQRAVMPMRAAWWMLTALAVLTIGYRYYSAFLAAKVLCLDDRRITPSHTLTDGVNFHPTNRWVLFGHHF